MSNLAITAANVLRSNGTLITGTAAAATTITQGQAVYVLANGTIGLADSNGSSPANTCAGIACNAASPGQPITYVATDAAFVLGASVTSGDAIYLSDTPGALTATYSDIVSGSTVIIVGIANGSTTMNLNPQTGGVK